jgi:hypothetical protein
MDPSGRDVTVMWTFVGLPDHCLGEVLPTSTCTVGHFVTAVHTLAGEGHSCFPIGAGLHAALECAVQIHRTALVHPATALYVVYLLDITGGSNVERSVVYRSRGNGWLFCKYLSFPHHVLHGSQVRVGRPIT